jgi:hypothetical protein
VRGPRGGAPVLTAPELRQSWVPRLLNATLGLFLLCFTAPVVAHLGGRPVWVAVLLLVFSVPVVLLALACLVSAVRPGTLGRLRRR